MGKYIFLFEIFRLLCQGFKLIFLGFTFVISLGYSELQTTWSGSSMFMYYFVSEIWVRLLDEAERRHRLS